MEKSDRQVLVLLVIAIVASIGLMYVDFNRFIFGPNTRAIDCRLLEEPRYQEIRQNLENTSVESYEEMSNYHQQMFREVLEYEYNYAVFKQYEVESFVRSTDPFTNTRTVIYNNSSYLCGGTHTGA